jgi:hypothetical protein
MKNVTISLDDSTMDALRKYASSRGQSLNAFLKELVSRTVNKPGGNADRFFELIDSMPKTKVGITWKREDLYRH